MFLFAILEFFLPKTKKKLLIIINMVVNVMFKNNRIVINIFLKHHVYNDPAVNGNYVYNYHNVWFIFLLRFDMTVL